MVDVLAAAGIFAALGCGLIAYIHVVTPQSGDHLLDLPAFFADLRTNPQHHWWLAVMLLSTLLPTIAHTVVATLAIVTLAPDGLRNRVRRLLVLGRRQGDEDAGWWGGQLLCLLVTLSVWAPVNILWYAGTFVWTGHWDVGLWLIDWFEGFARLIGAVP